MVSERMDKTIVVSVERRFADPLYGKQVTRHQNYYAHDEENQARTGDVVKIVETRPLSKSKRWRLLEVVRKAQ